jgi:K+-sensing histidine kinase KdpD
MGPVVTLHDADGSVTPTDVVPARPERATGLLWLAALGTPVLVAAALTPWRDRLAAADNALILVVVIVAVATAGHRWAAAACALSAALSFDFFLTRPYGSFRITRTSDLVTELLLLVVGLAVGDLAARGRTHRVAAGEGRRHLSALHTVTELAATGQEPGQVAAEASRLLVSVLGLRSCRFTRDDPDLAARVLPDGQVRIGAVAWSTGELGLPHRGVDLPIRGGGDVLAHFELVPEPGTRVPQDLLVVAVAIADQVGAALAAEHGRARRPH